MAAPGIPTNFLVQQGNSQVLLTWDLMAGATTYPIYKSTDNITFSLLTSPAVNQYLDTAVTNGTVYYYKIQSNNGLLSPFTSVQSIVPTLQGKMTLGQLRLQAQQRADRQNSNFVGTAEWNTYINQSAFELYDMLVTLYEDIYVAPAFEFQTAGSQAQYDLDVLIPDFYKLIGVDVGLSSTNNAFVTLKKFEFISRNRYVYPQITSTFLGVFNLRYRLIGNTLMFIPTPAGAQYVRLWYIPRMTQLLADNDIIDGVSGWTEYIIVDAAIKALQKEESDTSVLMAQKMALIDRIQSSAANRDAGQPDCISDTRRFGGSWGSYGGSGYDGPSGGN